LPQAEQGRVGEYGWADETEMMRSIFEAVRNTQEIVQATGSSYMSLEHSCTLHKRHHDQYSFGDVSTCRKDNYHEVIGNLQTYDTNFRADPR
jgi:hypothetical protein